MPTLCESVHGTLNYKQIKRLKAFAWSGTMEGPEGRAEEVALSRLADAALAELDMAYLYMNHMYMKIDSVATDLGVRFEHGEIAEIVIVPA